VWLPDAVKAAIVADVSRSRPNLRRGCGFSGLLYAGLAMTSSGPAVVELNCRFGDPETQAAKLLKSPLGQLLHATATGTLGDSRAVVAGRLRGHRRATPRTTRAGCASVT
jgi:phosphoribosylamine--glycine ligase